MSAEPSGAADSPEQVRAACDEFDAALTASGQILDAGRALVASFRSTGTYAVPAEMRSQLERLEADDTVFESLDRLDEIWRAEH
jgi:hypothetical protein